MRVVGLVEGCLLGQRDGWPVGFDDIVGSMEGCWEGWEVGRLLFVGEEDGWLVGVDGCWEGWREGRDEGRV